jgi:hypothetical protein
MQKALTEMNIQLAKALSDVTGVSGMKIITASLDGERDPYRLAELRDKRVKAGREEVARSLDHSRSRTGLLILDKVCRRSRPWSELARRSVVRTAPGAEQLSLHS